MWRVLAVWRSRQTVLRDGDARHGQPTPQAPNPGPRGKSDGARIAAVATGLRFREGAWRYLMAVRSALVVLVVGIACAIASCGGASSLQTPASGSSTFPLPDDGPGHERYE